MKKVIILAGILAIIGLNGVSVVNATETSTQTKTTIEKQNPNMSEEAIKQRKSREMAFEQKLGLTEEQKSKAKELRQKGHTEIKPIIEQLQSKKQEAKMVKLSRMSVQAQEEKLAVLDKEIQDLEKKANTIRNKNMKEFESILTARQKKILKDMKKEGRKNFENCHKPCPCPNHE
jgi:hypothetical protein